jgi:DNA-binding response OmpR family regulator
MEVLSRKTQLDVSTVSARPVSVLFIDFDKKRASSTCLNLKRVGLKAMSASDWTTATQFFDTITPHIVLLGSLPCVGGPALCRAIKRAAPNVILLTYTDEPEAWQLLPEFIDGLVPRCTSSQHLVEEICAWRMHEDVTVRNKEMRDRLASFRSSCAASG